MAEAKGLIDRRLAIVVVIWTIGLSLALAPSGGIAWHFFVTGSQLMFHGSDAKYPAAGGLDVYQNYPFVQIGPFALSFAELLGHLGPHQGIVAAEVLSTLLGFATVRSIVSIVEELRPQPPGIADRLTALVAVVVFMAGWQELAVAYAHLDDGLTILFMVLTLRFALHRQALVAGVMLALATDAKPWAAAALPLLLLTAADRDRSTVRQLALAGSGFAVVVLAAWLPFFLADDHLHAFRHYTIVNLPQSALRFIGVDDRRTPPWDRDAQLAAGILLGVFAIARRRWPAVLYLATMARLALDPATHSYYTCGPLAGALLIDLLSRRRLPVMTVGTYLALDIVPVIAGINSQWVGGVRFVLAVVVAAAVIFLPTQSLQRAVSWHSLNHDHA